MKIIKLKGSLREKKELENLKAENEKTKSQIDYIAMMTDVEFPESEEIEDEQI